MTPEQKARQDGLEEAARIADQLALKNRGLKRQSEVVMTAQLISKKIRERARETFDA